MSGYGALLEQGKVSTACALSARMMDCCSLKGDIVQKKASGIYYQKVRLEYVLFLRLLADLTLLISRQRAVSSRGSP
jgi:hypothetical protein